MQFRELFLTQSHLAIVMEFAAGGDMFDYVIKHKGSGGTSACQVQSQQRNIPGRQALMGAHAPAGPGEGLPETLARRFFQQLIFALDFCQRQGIANRLVLLLPPWDMHCCLLGFMTRLGHMTLPAGTSPSAQGVEHSACMQR